MNDDADFLVCAPADAPRACAGSVFCHRCHRCNRQLMMAPSGQRLLRRLPKVEIICAYCYKTVKGPRREQLAATYEEIAREARTAQPNFWSKRN